MGMLRASAGKIDLAPSVGDWMTGFAARVHPTTGTHDPITARALLLNNGETSTAIVSCDVLGFLPADAANMRRAIAQKSDIPKDNIIICCTHTHSGPASMPMRGIMGRLNDSWLENANKKIVDLVAGLESELQPAQIAHASTIVQGVGHNRQDNSHPIDEELIAISIESQGGSVIATLINYATHAVVLGPGNLEYSADFPGAAVNAIEQVRGGIGLYLQGACGDVNPATGDAGHGEQGFAKISRIGETLAQAAAEALENAPRAKDAAIRVMDKTIEIPLDLQPTMYDIDQLIAESQAQLDKAHAEKDLFNEQWALSMFEWENELKQAAESNTVPKWIPAKVIAVKINDLALISLPFETYSDIGTRIKDGLKPLKTAYIGYANGLYGYCASEWAYEQGGYGPGDSHRWFPQLLTTIAYGADEILVRECVNLIHAVKVFRSGIAA